MNPVSTKKHRWDVIVYELLSGVYQSSSLVRVFDKASFSPEWKDALYGNALIQSNYTKHVIEVELCGVEKVSSYAALMMLTFIAFPNSKNWGML